MTSLSEQPTPERIQEVAQQTFNALKQQESFFAFLRDRNYLHREIASCVKMISVVEPKTFSETDFAKLDSALAQVIEALERYFAKHGNQRDIAQCYFLGHSLNALKDSRKWIAQGFSPDPMKRPTGNERELMADELAFEIFNALKTA